MIVKVVQNLDTSIEIIDKSPKYSHPSEQLDWRHYSACQDSLEPYQSRVGDGDTYNGHSLRSATPTQHDDQVFRLTLNQFSIDSIEYLLVCFIVIDLVSSALGSIVDP